MRCVRTAAPVFRPLFNNGVHVAEIVDSSIAGYAPYLATISKDRTLRLWSYISWSCEIVFALDEHDDYGDGKPRVASVAPVEDALWWARARAAAAA